MKNGTRTPCNVYLVKVSNNRLRTNKELAALSSTHLLYIESIRVRLENVGSWSISGVFEYLNKNSNLCHYSLLWSMQSASLQSKRIEWQQIKFQTITHHFYCHRTTKFEELCTIKVAWGSNEKLKKSFLCKSLNNTDFLHFFIS